MYMIHIMSNFTVKLVNYCASLSTVMLVWQWSHCFFAAFVFARFFQY